MRSAGGGLDRDEVVSAALDVLAEVGLEGVTVRRIAERLGVKNPALYWHFDGKQAIVDAMAQRILAPLTAAAGKPSRASWDKALLRAARTFRRAMQAHREGARVVASADLSSLPLGASLPGAADFLIAAGFTRKDAVIGLITVFDYTLGATYEHQADPRRGEHEAPFKLDPDDVFERGLRLIVAGLAAQLRPRRTR